jgi:hypothetical protein
MNTPGTDGGFLAGEKEKGRTNRSGLFTHTGRDNIQ